MPSDQQPHSFLAATAMAAIVVGLVGRAVELTLPLMVGTATASFELAHHETGMLGSAQLAGLTLASLVARFWIDRWSWSWMAFGALVVFVVGNAVSTLASGFIELTLLRLATAFLGDGVLVVLAVATLGRQPNASRLYGIYMALQMCVGGALLYVQGKVVPALAFEGLIAVLVIFALPAFAVVNRLRTPVPVARYAPTGASPESARFALGPLLLLAGIALFQFNVGALWSYLEVMGRGIGISEQSIGSLLGSALLIGLPGALAAMWLGDRIAARTLLGLSAAGQAASLCILGVFPSVSGFVVGSGLFMMCWNLSVPYQISAVGEHPGGHRLLALVPACQAIGMTLGPVIAGLVSTRDDLSGMIRLTVIAALVTFGLFTCRPRTVARNPGTPKPG